MLPVTQNKVQVLITHLGDDREPCLPCQAAPALRPPWSGRMSAPLNYIYRKTTALH